MPRLRPEMEILLVNVCACTCCVHGRTGREVSPSCPQSILGMLFAAKVLRPGHRGTEDISLSRLAEGLKADRKQSEKKFSSGNTSSKSLTTSGSGLVPVCKDCACLRGSEI